MRHSSRSDSVHYRLKRRLFLSPFICFLAFFACHHAPPTAVSAFSVASPNNNNNKNPLFKSKSTASSDLSTNFSQGSEARRERLDAALEELGVNVTHLLQDAKYRGSAALRTYTSFVLPKSQGALAVAESPTRAAVVANNIYFHLQELQAHHTEWLRNHDKSLEEISPNQRQPLYIVLDNVRSAANVGNILRACEACCIKRVCLCGSMTPAPPNKELLKTAVGSAEYVPYTTHSSTLACVQELKKQGITVFAVETTSRSIPMWQCDMPQPLALVFGNELVGIHPDVMTECDAIVCIPTHGIKNSINVATCVSVIMWEALRQWNEEQAEKQ